MNGSGFDHPPEVGGYKSQSRLKPANQVASSGLRVESCEARFSKHSTQNPQLATLSVFVATDFSRWMKWEGEVLPSQKRRRMANSEWRIVLLEDSAPALPHKNPLLWRAAFLRCRLKFGRAGTLPSNQRLSKRRMNSVLRKIRHQPLAEASGMVSVKHSRGQTDALK